MRSDARWTVSLFLVVWACGDPAAAPTTAVHEAVAETPSVAPTAPSIAPPAPETSVAPPEPDPASHDEPCQEAVLADPASDVALTRCRARLTTLHSERPRPDEEPAPHSRALVRAAMARIAEARGMPEQAMFFLHESLAFEESAERRAHLAELAPRPVTATLHRDVLTDAVFRSSGSDTGRVLYASASALPPAELQEGVTRAYERLGGDDANDLELGVDRTTSPGERISLLRLRHGASWYGLDEGDSLTERGPTIVVRALAHHDFRELVGGEMPELVTEVRSLRLWQLGSCLFMAEDERTLRVVGFEHAQDGSEMAVRYAEIVIDRSQRHEPSLQCAEPPTEHRPTFHWSLEATFDAEAGSVTLTPTAGEFPPEIATSHDLRALHCTWGPRPMSWPCED